MCSIATALIKERMDILIYVGIDVANRKHDLRSWTIQVKSQIQGWSRTRFRVLKTPRRHLQRPGVFQDSKVRIGLESTGHYSINILHHLTKNDFKVMLINPLLTNMDQRSTSLRKTKTDKIDALAICMFLERNKHDFKPYTLKSYHTEGLKSLSRERLAIKRQLRLELNKLHALISVSFPEYYKVFKNIKIKVSYTVLKTYGVPSAIAKTRIDGLTNTLYKASRGHYGRKEALALKKLAKTTIGQSSRIMRFKSSASLNA